MKTTATASWITAAAVALLAGTRVLVSGTIYPWTGYAGNAALALILALAVILRKRDDIIDDRIAIAGMALYFIAAAVSVPCSVAPWNSMRWFVFSLGDLLLLLAVFRLARGRLRFLATFLLAAGAISAAWAMRQRLGGFAATLESGMADEFARDILSRGRVFGLTFSPDMLAGMMAGLLPLGLAMTLAGVGDFRAGRNAKISAVFLPVLCTVMFVAAILLSRSVGGLAAGGGGVIVWIILAGGGWGRKRSAAIIALVGIAIAAGLAMVIVSRGGHLLDLDNKNNPAFRRLDNFMTGLMVIREFPVTGAGGGQYGLAMLKNRSVAANEAKHTHNAAIEILAETGPAGLAGFLLIAFSFLRALWKLGREKSGRSPPPAPQPLRAAFAASGAAVLLHSMIDFDWQVMEVAALFWISLAVVLPGREHPERANGSGVARMRRAAIAALLITALAELYHAGGAWLEQRAAAKARAGDWARAREYAQRALEWDRTRDQSLDLVARSALAVSPGDPEARALAERSVRAAIALNPRYPFYYRDLGVLIAPRNREEAGWFLARAVKLYPNGMSVNLSLGRWLREQKEFERAKRVLDHARGCHVGNADVIYELALLSMDQGRTADAEEYLKQAAGHPFPRLSHVLAYSRYLEGNGRAGEALWFLQGWAKAHEPTPAVNAEIRRLEQKLGHKD